MPPVIHEFTHPGADSGTVVDVNNVDNELTVTLNGSLLTYLSGPSGSGDQFNQNITNLLGSGRNILTFSLVNQHASTPASINASVSIGGDTRNLNHTASNAPEGLCYQAFIFLDVP
jgi:hypothetical protein